MKRTEIVARQENNENIFFESTSNSKLPKKCLAFWWSLQELSSGGWKVSKAGEDGQESGELLNVLESVSGLKSFKLSTGDGAYYVVRKSVALPERYPFDVSDESFGIRVKKRGKGGDGGGSEEDTGSEGEEQGRGKRA